MIKQYTTNSEDEAQIFVEELEENGFTKLPDGDTLKPGFYYDWAGEDESGNLVFGIDYLEIAK